MASQAGDAVRSLPDRLRNFNCPVKSITSSASNRCDFQLGLNGQRAVRKRRVDWTGQDGMPSMSINRVTRLVDCFTADDAKHPGLNWRPPPSSLFSYGDAGKSNGGLVALAPMAGRLLIIV
jgi:hypothetical protein